METEAKHEHELVLDLVLNAPAEKLYRCWTEPELVVQWFAPKPWTTSRAEMDVRPGGASLIVMQSPEGQEFPNPGQYLEVTPGRRLVFTDAFIGDWTPSGGPPFMVAEVSFEALDGGRTRYVARARHWSAEAMAQHEAMGFHTGWETCARQLEALAQTI